MGDNCELNLQEEVRQMFESLKEKYLPELRKLYLKVALACQQFDMHQPKQPEGDQRIQTLRCQALLENMIVFLSRKEKMRFIENNIHSLITTSRNLLITQPQLMQSDSIAQMGDNCELILQEEVSQKFESLKETYLPELRKLYQKVSLECRQFDMQQPKQPEAQLIQRLNCKAALGKMIFFLSSKEYMRLIWSSIRNVITMSRNLLITQPQLMQSGARDLSVIAARHRFNRRKDDYVFERQLNSNVPRIKLEFVIPDELDQSIIGFHTERIACLEFHPARNNIVLSGDKMGALGILNYACINEKTIYNIHTSVLNNMKFNPLNDGTLYTASSDGTLRCTDLETGTSHLMDIHPHGWNDGASWKLYGMDINSDKGLVLVGDSFGYIYMLDMRSNNQTRQSFLIHRRGFKVLGLHCHPSHPELLLSCGNDRFARIWDMRRFEAKSSIYNLSHSGIVNSAYFSPVTGTKILTTSQDNRISVWDSIFHNLESPSRVIIHCHSRYSRWTNFQAEWDPKDATERLAVIGRHIRHQRKLQPIDFIDTSTGKHVSEVVEPTVTVCPLNKLHPQENVMASGAVRSLYIWRPKKR